MRIKHYVEGAVFAMLIILIIETICYTATR